MELERSRWASCSVVGPAPPRRRQLAGFPPGRVAPTFDTMATVTASPTARLNRYAMRLRRLGPDSLYVLTGLPLALVSFVVLVAGLALGIGLLITLLGIPVAALTLSVARWFAAVERARLPRVLGHAVSAPPYPQHEGQGLARRFGQLRDPQSWRDVVHGIAVLPVAVIMWSFAVTWWAAALGSILRWLL
jgi:hypothetical protein